MDGHVDTCLWISGLLTFMAFYIVLSVIYYFIELWPYEYNNDDSELLVFNEDYTEVVIINFYYDEEYSA